MSNWNSLPAEMRLAILEQLLQSPDVAPYAAVSKEWQAIIEKRNFHRLKLKQSCLDEFELIKQQRGLVKHVSLNIELRRYTCRCCRREESETWRRLNEKTIAAAVSKPFSILSTWAPTTGGMTLELNAYSPSDSEHRLKNCYFGAPGEDDGQSIHQTQGNSTSIDDPKLRLDQLVDIFDQDAIRRVYEDTDMNFKFEQLSVSFMVEAQHFFEARQPQWRWNRLRSLTLTSRRMTPTLGQPIITTLLREAGEAALCMPELQTMRLARSSIPGRTLRLRGREPGR
ncbi:hypothetical protein ACJ41O_001743 [Fusarium nematophilum]